MSRINIAIDGFAGCGKSTLAKDLARALNYTHIDSGAMYRAVTFLILNNQVAVYHDHKVASLLNHLDIKVTTTSEFNRIILNGEDVTRHLKTEDVSKNVSHVASLSKVRKKLVSEQKRLARNKGVVMDGRDIGTVVLPDAELKIFLTAQIDARVQRRKMELAEMGRKIGHEQIEENLKQRDLLDSTRKESPLRQAKDAVLIDNTNLTVDEQLKMVLALVHIRADN
jgi:cytidylate kinase